MLFYLMQSQNILQRRYVICINETKESSIIFAKPAGCLINATEISDKQLFFSLSIPTFTLLFR